MHIHPAPHPGAAIDFWQLPLSRAARRKLASIDESRKRHTAQKMGLAGMLLDHACDMGRGLYVPLSSHLYLPGKLTEDFTSVPEQINTAVGTTLCFFGNPLLLPEGFDQPQFDPDKAVKPKLRATNGGFVVVTIEHDCESRDQFEQILDWLSPMGKFKEVDDKLRPYRDYKGFCVVLSGNRSVHFHFIIGTDHLKQAPYDQSSELRWQSHAAQAAVMSNVHQSCWNIVRDVMAETLDPPKSADRTLESYTQFKRMPWGIRELEKRSEILDLPKGTVVPQLVLAESVRTKRSSKGSNKFIVGPGFSIPHYLKARKHFDQTDSAGVGSKQVSAGADMVVELASMCQSSWGTEFPKPVHLQMKDGHWIIHFQNHPDDKNPSTIVIGDFTTLRMLGQNAPPGPFTLPGDLSANEMGDHLALRFGLIENTPGLREAPEVKMTPFQRLKAQAGMSFKKSYEQTISLSFPHFSSSPVTELQPLYRQKLLRYLNDALSLQGDMIVLSAEGIGKTRALLDLMQLAALDTALQHNDGKCRFFVFAFRSRAQAEEKAGEYANKYRRAFVLKPFWAHYEEACTRLCVRPKPKEEFTEETDIFSVLGQIAQEQPAVYDELERLRKSLWLADDGTSLFTGTTLIFTTHATAMAWHRTHLNRLWHHPSFNPEGGPNGLRELRTEFVFEKVVFDEPEWDEFAYLLSQSLYGHLSKCNRWSWQPLSIRERKERFRILQEANPILASIGFEDYNELRFIDLASFDKVSVDYFSQPFGRENSPNSIYRSRHGTHYYFAARPWPTSSDSTYWIFLTTETFTTEAIAALYKAKIDRPLLRLELDNLPGLYPIDVPLAKSKMAKAEKIQALASEILLSSEQAVVIADGLGELKGDRAKTFQGMKGYNGWPDKDVFVVLTHVNPEVYARLNALGCWLGLDDTIAKYYAAQLSQAVGRNTGFRKKTGTKTVVVATDGLLRLIRSKLARFAPRVRLQISPDKFW